LASIISHLSICGKIQALYIEEIRLKRHFRDYILLLVIAGIIVILDQWTKDLVRTSLPYSEAWAPWNWMLPFARIVHWQNTGAAFGMFQGMALVFSILAIIVSVAIFYYFPLVPKEDWLIRVALGMMLGGALGNLIDRLQHNGAVTDFISVGNFAVFNVADASISVGVVVLILGMWLRERREERAKKQAAPVLTSADEPVVPGADPTEHSNHE
jgi:signal peptidase II